MRILLILSIPKRTHKHADTVPYGTQTAVSGGTAMNMYLDFPDIDGTPIAVALMTAADISPLPHCHEFYELTFITKGSCRHLFNGITALTAPGDVLITPPHQIHCFQAFSQVSAINCDFYPEKLGHNCLEILNDISPVQETFPLDPSSHVLDNHWKHIAFDPEGEVPAGPTGNTNAPELQGTIRLEGSEYARALSLLRRILDEQTQAEFGSSQMKSAFLQLILVLLSRVQTRKISRFNDFSDRKKNLVNKAIAYMERNLEKITSSSEIAEELFLSPAYFRALFKDITEMTPTNYLNRMRIIRSMEYLEREDLSISEAAAKVGIYDSNYYSRLFKKTMGYPPRYFKKSR